MTKRLLVWVSVLMLVASALGYSSSIDIDIDEDDCIDGWMSMDVEIEIDGEDFDLDPSCSFSYDETIETESGVRCEIEAGMCSSFSPEGELHIECSDGRDEEIQIPCPIDDFKLEINLDDSEVCEDDPRGSMDIEVEIEWSEEYDFRARCDQSLRESFETKSGDRCTIESSMCRGRSGSAKIEVECESGADETEYIECH